MGGTFYLHQFSYFQTLKRLIPLLRALLVFGRKPGQADKTTDEGEKQAIPKKPTKRQDTKSLKSPSFPAVHDQHDDDDDDDDDAEDDDGDDDDGDGDGDDGVINV